MKIQALKQDDTESEIASSISRDFLMEAHFQSDTRSKTIEPKLTEFCTRDDFEAP